MDKRCKIDSILSSKRKLNKIEKFKKEMIYELIDNTHKGNWEEFINSPEIHQELEYHLIKLRNAENENYHSKDGAKDKIKEYIADCANLLLMLGNSYRLYE